MKALTKRLLALGAGSVIAVAGGVVGMWEGKENHAYRDMVGIPTVCYGFTHGVKMGDYYTDEQCDKQLLEELTKFNTQMKKNVRVPLSENEEVAYTSFVWNVGVGAWNNSTLLKKLNAGDRVGACNEILKWNKGTFSPKEAAVQMSRGETCTVKKDGKYSCTVKGLTNRRQAEYRVCKGEDASIQEAIQQAQNEDAPERPVEALETSEDTSPTLSHPTPPESATEPSEEPDKACRKILWWCF